MHFYPRSSRHAFLVSEGSRRKRAALDLSNRPGNGISRNKVHQIESPEVSEPALVPRASFLVWFYEVHPRISTSIALAQVLDSLFGEMLESVRLWYFY
jgi:hypothetical protein